MTILRTPTHTVEITMTGVTPEGYDDCLDYSRVYIGNLADPNLHECSDDVCNLDGTGHYHCDDDTAEWSGAHCRAMELHNDRVSRLTTEQREEFRAAAETEGTYNVDVEDQPGAGEELLDRMFHAYPVDTLHQVDRKGITHYAQKTRKSKRRKTPRRRRT